MDDLEAARASDLTEADAWTDMIAAVPSPFAQGTGLRVVRCGGATVIIAPRIPDTLFNRAIGLGEEAPATEADLDAILALAREAKTPRFWVHVGRAAAPPELMGWIEARGLRVPARIARALELGCEITVTETGEPREAEPNPSLANMLRCGFVKVDSRKNLELA